MTREQAIAELKGYLKDYLETRGIDTRKNFRCLNPQHEDKNPSMGFDKANNQVHCFSCGAKYDVIDLISLDYNCGFNEALNRGCEMYHIDYRSNGSPSQPPKSQAELERERQARAAKNAEIRAREAASREKRRLELKAEFEAAQPATEHAYLKEKQVRNDGTLRVNQDNTLLIGLYDVSGEFKTYQRIFAETPPDGQRKKLAKGEGLKTAAFHVMAGEPLNNGDTVLLCEGYATGPSIYECISDRYRRCCVIMGVDSGNLFEVATAIKLKMQNIKIIIAADFDDAGIKAAKACCEAGVADSYILPSLSEEDKQAGLTDWNDYYCKYGTDKTRAALLAALENPIKVDVKDIAQIPDVTDEDIASYAEEAAQLRADYYEAQETQKPVSVDEQDNESKAGRSILDCYIPFGTLPKTEDDEIIASLFPRGHLSAIFAPAGTGKTWFILRLATLLSQGKALSPKFPVARPYKVMILSGEGGYDELIERANATAWSYDANNFGVVDLHKFKSKEERRERANEDISLTLEKPDGKKNFEMLIEAKQPDIVFLDSLMYYTDLDENKGREINPLMKYLENIARYQNIAIVPVHHARKRKLNELKAKQIMDELIGSNMFTRYFRRIIGLQPQGQTMTEEVTGDEPVIVRDLKFNRGKKFKPFTFQLADDPDTGKLDLFFNFEPDLTFKATDKKNEILYYIQATYKEGDDEFSRADLDTIFPKSTLIKALKELTEAGILGTTGKGRNLKYFLRPEIAD